VSAPVDRTVAARPRSAREAAFLGEGQALLPESVAQLGEIVREAERTGRALMPAGSGAHTDPADPSREPWIVSLEKLDAIVHHQPDDFTVGVQAGMPLARLRDELARHGQELPVDPGAAAAGTVGGLVARAPIGPRTHRHGSVSTLLLGAEGVRGGGHAWTSGGMVVKNVAGYQVAKLMAGSRGRAGFVTRANFRLRPIPPARAVRFASGTAALVQSIADALRASRLEPTLAVLRGAVVRELRDAGLPVPPGDAAVGWLFEGSRERVRGLAGEAERIVREAGGEPGPEDGSGGSRFLDHLADFASPAGSPEPGGRVRITVLPSRGASALRDALAAGPADDATAGAYLDPFLGTVTLGWSTDGGAGDAPVAAWTDVARRHGGIARALSLPPRFKARWTEPLTGDPTSALADRVLDVFDPHRLFRALPVEMAP